MSSQQVHELVVPYDPSALEAKVSHRRRLVRARIGSLVITVGILVALYLWQRDAGDLTLFWIGVGVSLALSVGFLIASILRHRSARRDLARTVEAQQRAQQTEGGDGAAVRVGPPGVRVGDRYAPWSEVSSLAAVKGGLGRSERLRLTTTDGTTGEVSFEQISVYPATLDGAARAYSAGRHGVDLQALDN